MNKIIVNLGNVKLDEIPLGRGSLNIGRASDNDISLADAATSAHHAKIVTIFTSSFIQDLNSTNGTIVNGRKVVRHTLHHGDIISIGNLQLLFKSDTNVVSEDSKKTITINKNEINDLLKKSKEVNNKPAEKSGKIEQKENLSGFSISIPQTNGSKNNSAAAATSATTAQELADSIPILDETLPLSELRNNSDTMVVLPPRTSAMMKSANEINNIQPAQEMHSNEVQEAADSPVAANDCSDTQLMVDSDHTNILDDEQIKEILESGQAYSGSSRRLARYAAILSVLVILSIAIYLAF